VARLVLRVERGGRLLGSWGLGDEPLEMSVHDLVTGEELGRFTAKGAPGRVDEVPIVAPDRGTGDDLTMPLPEPTDVGEALETTDGTGDGGAPAARGPAVPNLARRFGDDPRPTVTVAPDDTSDPAARRPLPSTRDLTTGEATETGGLPGFTEELSVELSVSQELSLELDPAELGLAPPPRPRPIPEAPPPTEDVPRVSRALPFSPPIVRPAEVWVLRDNAWRNGGSLQPGQRATARGGWVRLENDGRLTVTPGAELSGSSTLTDGRAIDIAAGTAATRLPPGASVLLRSGPHGIYVRSEPIGGSRPSGPRAASGTRA